ncbi:AMP-binding protein [Parvularcula sp. LCG005]|uniref:AMP-binding protein n=1 Tax=Parvularcula sp. LCG005 TaxID=3078805 RepID=UPI002943A021|nr:AMP-binding protein [Parvularcula sp. LCG005]WOI53101.1 AMP-binding protein [Parvularcula sp. LCG005]
MADEKTMTDAVTPEPANEDGQPHLADAADERERAAADIRRQEEARQSRRKIWSRSRSTLIAKLIEAKKRYGADKVAMIEPDGRTFTYKQLVQGAFALGNAFRRVTSRGEHVGVMMPTTAGGVIAILALHVDTRVPAMLNFTAGEKALRAALDVGQIKTIITSRQFIEVAQLEHLVEALSDVAEFKYLEDIKDSLKKVDKLRAGAGTMFPALLRRPTPPESPGVILFTSGTEGNPKGVVLSHQNLCANVEQICDHVELEPTDIFINPLPIFHSYGLTGGIFFGILSGKAVIPYPSPLHTKIIPEMIEKHGATIIFATDTFLHRYLRSAKPGSMATIRYAVCGAERVRDETRALAKRLFGFNVLEGYGATEAAPVIAVNQPGDIRPGTVGKMLPGIETRIEPVEGLSDGGRLFVRGPNVMSGYIDPDQSGALIVPEDGWHDTGDIVHIDGGGYLSIRGRQKRFAKIAGEMVSLAVVENCASVVWPDSIHAAIIMPDPKKGEQIILLTEEPDPKPETLKDWARAHGVPELALPRRVLHVDDIPMLGTGKVDYIKLNDMAEDMIAEAEAQARAAE